MVGWLRTALVLFLVCEGPFTDLGSAHVLPGHARGRRDGVTSLLEMGSRQGDDNGLTAYGRIWQQGFGMFNAGNRRGGSGGGSDPDFANDGSNVERGGLFFFDQSGDSAVCGILNALWYFLSFIEIFNFLRNVNVVIDPGYALIHSVEDVKKKTTMTYVHGTLMIVFLTAWGITNTLCNEHKSICGKWKSTHLWLNLPIAGLFLLTYVDHRIPITNALRSRRQIYDAFADSEKGLVGAETSTEDTTADEAEAKLGNQTETETNTTNTTTSNTTKPSRLSRLFGHAGSHGEGKKERAAVAVKVEEENKAMGEKDPEDKSEVTVNGADADAPAGAADASKTKDDTSNTAPPTDGKDAAATNVQTDDNGNVAKDKESDGVVALVQQDVSLFSGRSLEEEEDEADGDEAAADTLADASDQDATVATTSAEATTEIKTGEEGDSRKPVSFSSMTVEEERHRAAANGYTDDTAVVLDSQSVGAEEQRQMDIHNSMKQTKNRAVDSAKEAEEETSDIDSYAPELSAVATAYGDMTSTPLGKAAVLTLALNVAVYQLPCSMFGLSTDSLDCPSGKTMATLPITGQQTCVSSVCPPKTVKKNKVCMCATGHAGEVTWLEKRWQSTCSACGIGKYQDEVGKKTCKKCTVGQSSIPGNTSCFRCREGTWPQGVAGCQPSRCPTNKNYAMPLNGTTCKCKPGYYGTVHLVQDPTTGEMGPQSGEVPHCTQCATGTHSGPLEAEINTTNTCFQGCPIGHVEHAGMCQECKRGRTYQDEVGLSVCKSCWRASVNDACRITETMTEDCTLVHNRKCVCNEGYVGNDGTNGNPSIGCTACKADRQAELYDDPSLQSTIDETVALTYVGTYMDTTAGRTCKPCSRVWTPAGGVVSCGGRAPKSWCTTTQNMVC